MNLIAAQLLYNYNILEAFNYSDDYPINFPKMYQSAYNNKYQNYANS